MRKKAGAELSDALVDQIFDRTGGVPLFVEEFTKMVQESGALEATDTATSTLAEATDPRDAPGPGDGAAGPDGGRA